MVWVKTLGSLPFKIGGIMDVYPVYPQKHVVNS
jgi:hypothetical protein